jgi:cardiolipin synthase (CMP-forming)
VRHLPNLICLFRIALVWPIASALYGGRYGLALGLFVLAAVSDGLDGWLAKRFSWTSELGKWLDPIADKLLLVTIFITATWVGLVPWWVTAAAVARDVLIISGTLVFLAWFGPVHGRPRILSKFNTALQLVYLSGVMVHAAAGLPPRELLAALALLMFGTTVVSGLDYVYVFARRAWHLPPRPA